MGGRRGAATGEPRLSGAGEPVRLIVNADDLGWSDGVNEGIFRAHREGIVTSATLAANMPAAGAAAARLESLPGLGVGVHLNACQGPALSATGREVLAGRGGMMDSTGAAVIRRCIFRRRRTLKALEAEFDAQICRALELGVRATHLDTHRHVHAWPAVFRLVARLCSRYDIAFVRWHREVLPAGAPPPEPRQRRIGSALTRLGRRCRKIAPQRIATNGTLGVAHTGRIDVAFLLAAVEALRPGATEIMVHPGYAEDLPDAESRLRQSRRAEVEALCDPRLAERIAASNIELIHYGHLA